jgi:hypothetical protein
MRRNKKTFYHVGADVLSAILHSKILRGWPVSQDGGQWQRKHRRNSGLEADESV